MVKEIQMLQNRMEQHFVDSQDSIEKMAMELSGAERIKYLTDYSDQSGKLIHRAWLALGDYLVMKYNDGYVKDSAYKINAEGYPEEWLKTISGLENEKYLIPAKNLLDISKSTYELVKDHFTCAYRGKVSAKHQGEIDMYFVEG